MTTVNDVLIEELLAHIPTSGDPRTGMAVNDVVHPGDVTLPVPIVVSSMEAAGQIYIYDNRTGARSISNQNMLREQLKKRRPDGSPVFTTIKPAVEPIRGTLTCLLHSSRPDVAKYLAMGFSPCPKSNLPSEFMLEQHMQHKHRVEWATIQQERERAEREEERAFQRSLIALVGSNIQEKAGPVEDRRPPTEPDVFTKACEICGQVFTTTGKSALGIYNKLKAHKKKEHPPA